MLSSPQQLGSRAARRSCARNAERLRAHLLGAPKRGVRDLAKCSAQQIVSCFGGAVCAQARALQPEGSVALLRGFTCQLGIGRARAGCERERALALLALCVCGWQLSCAARLPSHAPRLAPPSALVAMHSTTSARSAAVHCAPAGAIV